MTHTESPVQATIRLTSGLINAPLWRNNSGAFNDGQRWVRYGLMNDSHELNLKIKSSDLIGPTPLLIMPQHVGTVVGVFTAIECKAPGWHLTPGDARGMAQLAFHDLVRRYGGLAGFATSVDDYRKIIGR